MEKENYSYKILEFYAILDFLNNIETISLNCRKFKYLLWYDKGKNSVKVGLLY